MPYFAFYHVNRRRSIMQYVYSLLLLPVKVLYILPLSKVEQKTA